MKQSSTTTAERTRHAKAGTIAAICEQISALSKSVGSQPAFYTAALREIARAFSSPYAAVHVQLASQVIQDDCHSGPTDPQFWKGSVQRFLTECLGDGASRTKVLQSKSGSTRIAFLSAPIVAENGSPIGALALVVGPVNKSMLASMHATLEAAVCLISHLARFAGTKPAQKTNPQDKSTTSASELPISSYGEFSSAEQMAFAITGELRNALSADMVAIGLVQRSRIQILSVSGLDDVRKQSPGIVVLRAAMEECLDTQETLVYQREQGWSEESLSTGHRLHKQWHASAKGDAVASIPFRLGERVSAVLSVRRRPEQPFKSKTLDEIRKRVEPMIPGLVLSQKANRGLFHHALDSTRQVLEKLTTPGHWTMKLATACVVLLVTWFFFGTIQYNLTVPATLRAAAPIHIASPFDGVLESVHALEGDLVKAGDILCRLDTADLRLQRAELLAQISVLEREKDRATANKIPTEAQLAMANQELALARLAVVDRKIERSLLRSPIDGMVVAGDLRTRIGATVPVGEPLLTVSPAGRWTLELEVAESSADEVASGIGGSFATFARPENGHSFRVSRVLPAVHARDQSNVFIAEAEIQTDEVWVRPGMEGFARVHLGSKPVWWAALHRAIDYLRLKLWL